MLMDEWSQERYRAEPVPGAANLAVTSGQHRQVAEARQTICRWSKRIHPSVKRLFVYRSCHIKWDNIMVNMFPYIKTKTLRYWQCKQATFTLHSLFVSSVYSLYDIYFYIQVLRLRNLFDCRWKLYLFGFGIKVRLFPPTLSFTECTCQVYGKPNISLWAEARWGKHHSLCIQQINHRSKVIFCTHADWWSASAIFSER